MYYFFNKSLLHIKKFPSTSLGARSKLNQTQFLLLWSLKNNENPGIQQSYDGIQNYNFENRGDTLIRSEA